jgi:hypothetical protein
MSETKIVDVGLAGPSASLLPPQPGGVSDVHVR